MIIIIVKIIVGAARTWWDGGGNATFMRCAPGTNFGEDNQKLFLKSPEKGPYVSGHLS